MRTLLSGQICLPSLHAFMRILMFTHSLEKKNCNKGDVNNFSLLVACPIQVKKKKTHKSVTPSKFGKNTFPFLRFCLNKKISKS